MSFLDIIIFTHYNDLHTEKKDGAKTLPVGNHFEKWCPFLVKEAPKQFPFGKVPTTKKAPLCRWGAKTVLLGAPNYGQPNSTPRGAVSAPFFSECGLDYFIIRQNVSWGICFSVAFAHSVMNRLIRRESAAF